MTVCFKGSVEGPRWAGFARVLKKQAFLRDDVKITIVDVDKGLLRERVLFKVEGTKVAVDEFRRQVQEAVDKWNKED